jgi:hypothetical protein
MPPASNLDPLQLPFDLLSNLMLVDVLHNPRRYRYRLLGIQVAAAAGEDRTGCVFENEGRFKVRPLVVQQYEGVADTGLPLYSTEPLTNFTTGSTCDVERLLLPFASADERVETILALFHFKAGPMARHLRDG